MKKTEITLETSLSTIHLVVIRKSLEKNKLLLSFKINNF